MNRHPSLLGGIAVAALTIVSTPLSSQAQTTNLGTLNPTTSTTKSFSASLSAQSRINQHEFRVPLTGRLSGVVRVTSGTAPTIRLFKKGGSSTIAGKIPQAGMTSVVLDGTRLEPGDYVFQVESNQSPQQNYTVNLNYSVRAQVKVEVLSASTQHDDWDFNLNPFCKCNYPDFYTWGYVGYRQNRNIFFGTATIRDQKVSNFNYASKHKGEPIESHIIPIGIGVVDEDDKPPKFPLPLRFEPEGLPQLGLSKSLPYGEDADVNPDSTKSLKLTYNLVTGEISYPGGTARSGQAFEVTGNQRPKNATVRLRITHQLL
jgi:hypothetical protein